MIIRHANILLMPRHFLHILHFRYDYASCILMLLALPPLFSADYAARRPLRLRWLFR